jgi:hypothetical protein
MPSNQSTIEHLNSFINSSRADEHYHALCEACGTSIPTEESRQQVGDAKALAARLIVQLSSPSVPDDLWVTAVHGTIFDSDDAIRTRNPVVKPDKHSEQEILAMMVNGHSDPNTTRHGCFGHADFKDGYGRSSYEVRVDYIKARARKGSNVNPYGLAKIPDHHSLCPNAPESVETF